MSTTAAGTAPCLSFLTDFGLQDVFVAACHGVMATLAPHSRIIDVTHLVPPGDIRQGAALLAQALPHLPPAGVHVAVVDPGVGTSRRAIAVSTESGHRLVGPDNGLLLPAADALGGVAEARELSNAALHRHPVSRTFHGRDVFSPVAARLAVGTPFAEVGPELDAAALVRLPEPRLALLPGGAAETEIVTVDRFGNLQTGLDAALLDRLGLVPGPGARVRVGAAGAPDGGGEVPLATTFGDVPVGGAVAYLDSSGLLTLAVNGGSAAARFGLGAGEVLRVSGCG
ncbi:hypothetical protein BIV57_13025 [Mangrovactinospora gilvigrisea]|uniref:SAM-dependent chlorinase/fluorinase n=1 Tax=Mangrovactinospora gilvigrisea TaxID=1428644 RepID=A0A1J7BUE5_9ACTN|nr:SAM-dependent chlorinase/fluorinase [Mangrovactinospora gilvigrisea]OIV37081.1 hypothetical protein BIV57_13025 [Mangrovactinospora gilvigrisea]